MSRRLVAEFEPQSFVQIIFPHAQSDWALYLEEASQTFTAIATAIARFEPCLIVCDDLSRVRACFTDTSNLHFVTYQSDDTWARDCSAISVESNGKPLLLNFTFNGWGNKFDAARDNAMTHALSGHYGATMEWVDLVLEGGGIESNGQGTLLATTECLFNPNRNAQLHQNDIETTLRTALGIERFLWLHHGYLAGDDTDSHIDTLARFISPTQIMYVQCRNETDEHYEALHAMEHELRTFRTATGEPYELIPLPMCDAVYYDAERLPATYANFLMLNGAVLVPVYNLPQDEEALRIFQTSFPEREIVALDCSVLIRQHGSLHCVTMQFPVGVNLC